MTPPPEEDRPSESPGEAAAAWGSRAHQQRQSRDAFVCAITLELAREGVDVMDLNELELTGIFQKGNVGMIYATAGHKQFGKGTRVLLRRCRRNLISLFEASEVASELAQMRRLNHPHILPLLGVASDSHLLATLMERMPGNLASLLLGAEKTPRLSKLMTQMYTSLMHGVGSGLQYLHSERMNHFSLHPGNILISADVQAKLSDYGRPPATVQMLLRSDQNGASHHRLHYLRLS